eukprot:9310941-Pyramimonas_sp.AAC.1
MHLLGARMNLPGSHSEIISPVLLLAAATNWHAEGGRTRARIPPSSALSPGAPSAYCGPPLRLPPGV